jgi:hypothetical protein
MSLRSGLLLISVLAAHLSSAYVIDRSPEADIVQRNINITEIGEIDFSALSLPLSVGAEPPKGGVECPATNNGPNRNYPKHKYTENQLKAAFMTAARLAADEKQIGDRKSFVSIHTFVMKLI